MDADTNLPDMHWRFTDSGADAGQLSLRFGNGLPQLSPAPVRMVDLPPVNLKALLLELQQHPVPGGVRLPDLIPYHLKAQKKKKKKKTPQSIASVVRARNQTQTG